MYKTHGRTLSLFNQPGNTPHDMWDIYTGDFHLLETADIYHHCKIYFQK